MAYARKVFPELLAFSPERITICVNGYVSKEKKHIRIGPMAWPAVVPTLHQYEVLDIFVRPESEVPKIVVTTPPPVDVDALPKYEDVKEKCGSVDFISPSRAPSPRMKQLPINEIRAGTCSATNNAPRPPSPSGMSISDWAKSLFGKRVE